MNNLSLAQFMQTQPDGTLEAIAEQFNTSLLAVVQHLPQQTLIGGNHFDAVWDAATKWGRVTTLVHTADVILEFSGDLPTGSHGQGYFNLRGTGGMSGHIRADHCRHIALVERKFMGLDTASILFFNQHGAIMLKVFLGRNAQRQLLPQQLAAFRALSQQLKGQ